MDPSQALFTWLLIDLRQLGYDVYDGDLPPEGTPYPFIYFGDTQLVDAPRKNIIQGTAYMAIHVYHDKVRERGKVNAIIDTIRKRCRYLESISPFLLASCSTRMLPDETTDKPLLHGILEIGMRF